MAQQQSVSDMVDVSDSSPRTGSNESTDPVLLRNASFSKLNAKAPEFVPVRTGSGRSDGQPESHSQTQKMIVPPTGMVHMYSGGQAFVPIQNPHQQQHIRQYHHGYDGHRLLHNPYFGGGGDGGGFMEHEKEVEVQQLVSESQDHVANKKPGPSEDIIKKVVNQVEYYFSDLNLATTDHLMRFINKDPEGYVSMSVVLSFKKIKSFTTDQTQLAKILRHSTKLVVSEDGKKLKRLHSFTEADLEELQSRIVIAENLPEDHSYQNLMRIFSAVGNVKNIRTCQPQPNNGGSSTASRSAKADNTHLSNKLHAFVEYANVELTEKAVAEMNNEGNWRSGIRVKFFSRHMSKHGHTRGRKGHDGEGHNEEDVDHQTIDKDPENTSSQPDFLSHEQVVEENANDREGPKQGRGRGRGKGRGRGQPHQHNNRGNHQHIGATNNHTSSDHHTVTKQPPGPRMPDGTKGFTMGRGKPVAVAVSTSLLPQYELRPPLPPSGTREENEIALF